MAKRRRTGGRRSGAAPLLAVGEGIVEVEQGRLRSRLIYRDGGEVVVLEGLDFVPGLGLGAVVQAAAVLLRVADEVCVVVPGRPVAPPGAAGSRRGIAEGWAAAVCVGTRSGGFMGRQFYGVPRANGRTVVSRDPMSRAALARFGDFSASELVIDPALEDRLAQLGFPGAVRRVGAAVAEAAGPRLAVRPNVPRFTDAPWESARQASDLLDLAPVGLGYLPAFTPGSASPVDLMTRSIPDLLRACVGSDSSALHLAQRVARDTDIEGAVALVRSDDRLSPAVRAMCLAHAAGQAMESGEASQIRLGEELVTAVDALCDGDSLGWLRARWPESPGPGDEIVTAWMALVATDAFWRLVHCHHAAIEAGSVGSPGASGAVGAALRHVAAVRDGLLDLTGVTPGEAGARLVRLTAQVMEMPQPPWGEPRIERFHEARVKLVGRAAPRLVLSAYALWHAAVLHAVWVIGALQHGPPAGVTPSDVDPAGLLGRGRHVLARHLLIGGMQEGDAELLDRAVAVAPTDFTVRRVANEGRFRLGRRDAALLDDLRAEESFGGTLATAAEALAVAAEVGDPAAARLARRRLRERSSGELAPLVALRLAVDRAADVQDSALAEELRSRVPAAPPDDSRAAHALLGSDPAATLEAWRRALTEQRDALEWAALVREERADAPAAVRAGRPTIPTEPEPGALAGAHHALRWRLDRRSLAHHPMKGLLEDHARGALELVASDDAAGGVAWLRALGGEGGLVATLDRAVAGDDRGLPEALAEAGTALGEALAARWLTGVHERLSSVWVGGADPEIHRERRALEAEAAQAADADGRAAVDARVGALLARAAETQAAEGSRVVGGSPADEGADEPVTRFAPMRVSAAALEHGRRALGTPEWAIQEGLRQVLLYNRTLGRRDQKMLRGTRDDAGALWELRHRDGRNPVRVLYRHTADGPQVVSILAKRDDAHQRRAIAKVSREPAVNGNDATEG